MAILATKQLHICNGKSNIKPVDANSGWINICILTIKLIVLLQLWDQNLVFVEFLIVFHTCIYTPWRKILDSVEFIGITFVRLPFEICFGMLDVLHIH